MLDTMTLTKVVGGLCGALLVFLLGGWVAEAIYVGPEEQAAEGEELHQAYAIEVPEGDAGAGEPVDEGPPFEEVFAVADAAAGEGEFRPCSACHSLADGENRTGPSLHGVVDRPVDAVAGFDYSGALEEVVDVWSPDHLNGFLADPAGYAPGTKMNFNGIDDVADRANLIAYLATNPGG